ncbi:hypothetical protein DPX16_22176 [Anabarilius grahami]|uniref:Uncharacterized protein n=1 Tax=Anabarilius grahami TaxID=495550 RepID=A0A3N0XQ96_ANAGA|nr:hypothetical protein DPX16_22176 [Anabarilius grahami]
MIISSPRSCYREKRGLGVSEVGRICPQVENCVQTTKLTKKKLMVEETDTDDIGLSHIWSDISVFVAVLERSRARGSPLPNPAAEVDRGRGNPLDLREGALGQPRKKEFPPNVVHI